MGSSIGVPVENNTSSFSNCVLNSLFAPSMDTSYRTLSAVFPLLFLISLLEPWRSSDLAIREFLF